MPVSPLGIGDTMLLDFFASELGVYLLALALAVGVSLMLNVESTASWVGTIVITAAFVLVAITQMAPAPGAVPLYVVALSVGGVAAEVRRYSDSPLLVGEPYWRKFLLTLTHRRRIREAALREAAASQSTRAPARGPCR